MVDVWQANPSGAYDNATPDFNYRGRQQTDATGNYSFTSVEPGWYLNGSQYRPRHIHFRVTAPGYTELITQLYFQNDPYIAADPWASSPAAQLRIVPITDINGTPTADFQITLNGTATGLQQPSPHVPVKVLQNPFQTQLGFGAEEPILNQPELRLHLPHLSRGLYFARVQTPQGIFVLQVVKE